MKIMKIKKYIKLLSLTMILFISYHLVIWFFFTSKVLDPKNNTSIGDLGRMSYQTQMLHNRELKYTLDKSHIYKDTYKEQKIDILTIGDSFSRGGGGGTNPYYQDFISTKYNKNILNIAPYGKYNSLETIISLYNSGELERLKPKIIIVESVVRITPKRYGEKLNMNISDAKLIVQSKFLSPEILPSVYLINTANYKLPFYSIKYHFNNNAFKNVYKFDLTKKLFTKNNGKKVLIYKDDIALISQFTIKNIETINSNFNKVAKLLQELNIKLFFMPAPDKYDLYSNFIVDNKYQKNPFFDTIRELDKEYIFIDTKSILLKLLDNGVKDVYWIDDTHWTQKASEAISKDKVFNILKK